MYKIVAQIGIDIDIKSGEFFDGNFGNCDIHVIYTDEDIFNIPSLPIWIIEKLRPLKLVPPNARVYKINACEHMEGVLIK